MEEFSSPYVLSFIAGLASILISFFESKYSNENRTLPSYIKLFVLVTIITMVVLYISTYFNHSVNILNNQEILTGNPNF